MSLPKMNEILINVADKKGVLFKINDPDMDILKKSILAENKRPSCPCPIV